ncbi:alpha/beta fold hydrolase [Kineococcus sp. T13]|uniref:alpha/beta fold hydrolase n=1 Tax=Kineococcus vitellinus TaxID=2696565 RepID=UPI0014133DB7|nr:alpha/beta fold hydrolase [Kineococcus vitellinus]
MDRPMPRRLLLGASLASAAGLAACTSGGRDTPDEAPSTATATPSPTATPTPTEEPFVPPGLQESQRDEYRFGDHPRQVSDLWLPAGERREAIVVLVHGGGWDAGTDRRDLNALVADLVQRGWPVLNVDYRGNGDGGGWPGTFTDLATAVDMAAEAAAEHGLPLERTAVVGHSAGGHLAVWAAARHTLAAGEPGAGPRVVPVATAAMAGVLHPTALGEDGGDPNVQLLFGGPPSAVDERYAVGDPTRRVPLGMPLLVLHGTADDTVPPSQAQEFAQAAQAAGDRVDLRLLEGVSHGDPKEPEGATFPQVREWLESVLG